MYLSLFSLIITVAYCQNLRNPIHVVNQIQTDKSEAPLDATKVVVDFGSLFQAFDQKSVASEATGTQSVQVNQPVNQTNLTGTQSVQVNQPVNQTNSTEQNKQIPSDKSEAPPSAEDQGVSNATEIVGDLAPLFQAIDQIPVASEATGTVTPLNSPPSVQANQPENENNLMEQKPSDPSPSVRANQPENENNLMEQKPSDPSQSVQFNQPENETQPLTVEADSFKDLQIDNSHEWSERIDNSQEWAESIDNSQEWAESNRKKSKKNKSKKDKSKKGKSKKNEIEEATLEAFISYF